MSIRKASLYVAGVVGAILLAYQAFDRADAPMDLCSARIIDLSATDLSKFAVGGYAPTIRWVTQPHAGVALWDYQQQTFLVFAVGVSGDPSGPSFLRFDPDELPAPSKRFLSEFRLGLHLRCRTSDVSSIDIQMSRRKPMVGSIRVSYNGQGWPIDYSGDDEYLF